MLKARVSHLESFRQWKADDDLGLGWLLERLGESEPTQAMRAGTAFHKALELAEYDDFEGICANGYTFHFEKDCQIEISRLREITGTKKYGELLVQGTCDCLDGRLVSDHKTTAQFDPDRFMSGYQWRFYLDIFEADLFRWNVFVIRETDESKTYLVTDYHRLEQRRYPDMRADCEKLAQEYVDFAKVHLVNRPPKISMEETLKASLELSQQDVEAVFPQ